MIPFILIMAAVAALDQLSKLWIVKHFALHESLAVIPGLFNLTYLRNTGAAFGMLRNLPEAGRQAFFIGIGCAALIVLIIMQLKMGRQSFWCTVSFALIGGGAIGNLIDRVFYGSVVDFLDFYISTHHWPAFNVADSGITVGAGILLLSQLLEEKKAQHETGSKSKIS